ncbi:hypothetical protein [Prochlorothrix hollandica]|nr:hypothetical protein [Prochlorothrix hollandica]
MACKVPATPDSVLWLSVSGVVFKLLFKLVFKLLLLGSRFKRDKINGTVGRSAPHCPGLS